MVESLVGSTRPSASMFWEPEHSATNDLPWSGMTLANCDASNPSQKFAFEAPGSWAWQQLHNPATNTCAEVTDNDPSNGKLIRQAGCESYAATGQGWRLDPGGPVILRMDSDAPGGPLKLTACAAGSTKQNWVTKLQ